MTQQDQVYTIYKVVNWENAFEKKIYEYVVGVTKTNNGHSRRGSTEAKTQAHTGHHVQQ